MLTPFGKGIKKHPMDTDRTQTWLIERVQGAARLYFDRSYIHEIQVDQLATPKIIQAIRDILDLPEQRQDIKAEG